MAGDGAAREVGRRRSTGAEGRWRRAVFSTSRAWMRKVVSFPPVAVSEPSSDQTAYSPGLLRGVGLPRGADDGPDAGGWRGCQRGLCRATGTWPRTASQGPESPRRG